MPFYGRNIYFFRKESGYIVSVIANNQVKYCLDPSNNMVVYNVNAQRYNFSNSFVYLNQCNLKTEE